MRSHFQYDFDEDQMDQNVTTHKVLKTQDCPLKLSRLNQEGQSSHRRVLMDLEKFIQESKNKQKEKEQQLKQRQKHIGEMINHQQKQKEEKIKRMKEEQKKKLKKQCTFKPKLETYNGPRRQFDEFLENQNAHSQKIMEKRQQLKKDLEDKKNKPTYRPKVNSRSKNSRRESRQNSTTVFDRLYNLREKQKSENDENFEDSKKMFHPTINERSKNMQREGTVDELLYNDAQRRQEKEKQHLYTSFSQTSKFEKSTSYNNNKYAAQKFIKEFFFVLEDLRIDASNQATIEYVMFNELLKQMGFVTNEEEQQTKASSNQRALVHDAYEVLEKYQVNAHNVCVFLLGLLGIYNIYPVDFQDEEEPLMEKEFNLDEGSGRKLQRHFDLFYRNRLSSEVVRRNEQRVESYSFQPKINKQSNDLAEKHRNLMLEEATQLLENYPELEFTIPEDGVISHTELLVLHKMAKDMQKQVRRQELEDKEMEECTFKPNTISSMTSMNASKMSEGHLGYKKSFQLYNFHKNLQSKKESLQYNRSQEDDKQCTFAPQINRNKPLKHPLAPVSKQTEETLFRMHKGRQEYEEKKSFLERGEKTKSRSRNQSLKSEPERLIHLILDVNLGDKTERLVIYKGDEGKLDEVAHEFVLKHELQEEEEETLLKLLEQEMNNLLEKIEEDEESEDGQY